MPGWNETRLEFGPDGANIAALKRDVEGTLLLVASPSLARALTDAGLIDEYHLAIQPIFAGHGPTFLAGLSAPRKLRLHDVNLHRDARIDSATARGQVCNHARD